MAYTKVDMLLKSRANKPNINLYVISMILYTLY